MKELTVKAVVENIPRVTAFLEEALEQADCPMKAIMQIGLAVDELFGNIANYAYPDGAGNATVRLEIDEAAREASLTFIDEGVPYDPLAKEDPDVTLPAEERQIGGLGIFLVKKTMDGMRYERSDGKNLLTITKKY